MNKEEEKQFNQFFNNEEHCEELNIIRYNVLKFIDENYISKVEVKEKIEEMIIKNKGLNPFPTKEEEVARETLKELGL